MKIDSQYIKIDKSIKYTYTMEEIVSNSFSMEHEQRLYREIAIHSVLKGLFKQLLTIFQIATLS